MRHTDNPAATLLMVGSMAAFAVEDLFLKRAAEAARVLGASPVRVIRSPVAFHTTTLMDCW